jgi:hypothetical protein
MEISGVRKRKEQNGEKRTLVAAAKTFILIPGTKRDLNRETNPGSLGGLSVDMNGGGDGGFNSKAFTAKYTTNFFKVNGSMSPVVSLGAWSVFTDRWLSHCEKRKGGRTGGREK